MIFSVVPTEQNQEYENIENATVYCWIKSTDIQSSYITASFFIEKSDWIIKENTQKPIEVIEDDFIGQEIGLEHFLKAQSKTESLLYIAESESVTTPTKIELQSSYKFNMSKFLQKLDDISKEGRCLHYRASDRCNEIIKAHSIQNNRVLSEIADEKKAIYALSKNMSDFEKNDGNLGFRKYSIHKFSIFRGFCGNHDNDLFKPIDTLSFKSENQKQVFLYAYRSLAKELFDKENSLNIFVDMLEDVKDNIGLYKHISSHIDGITPL